MCVSKEAYGAACTDYIARWQPLDVVLYDLCQRFPHYADPAGINAKVWIIARTYASGIERSVNSDGSHGSSLNRVAGLLASYSQEVDSLIGRIREAGADLKGSLRVILRAHAELDHMLRMITRDGRSARSFSSKYLHFHVPAVPLYDAQASAASSKLYPITPHSQSDPSVDAAYAAHAKRLLMLASDLRVTANASTLKLMDYYLLNLGGTSPNPANPA